MNQTHWNSLSLSGPVTAEEFTAAVQQASQSACGCSRGSDCGCQRTGCDNSCQHQIGCGCQPSQVVCYCQSVPTPCPQPIHVDEGCCCKQGFRAALQLLCNSELASLLDFDQAAFLTDTYVAGATINTTAGTAPSDNLNTLSGSFRRFSPCNCDLLELSAPLYTPPETNTGVTATQVSLCQLTAVVLQAATAPAEGDVTSQEATARNFRRIQCILAQYLEPCGTTCGQCSCPCSSCDDCCCSAGLLSTLSQSNLSRRVSLAAGPLILQGVTLLGTAGNVLVLANDTNNRIYFVCVNQVQFLA